MTYVFTVAIVREGTWYVARAIEYGVTSQGKTITEARRNITEAVELYLEELTPRERTRLPHDSIVEHLRAQLSLVMMAKTYSGRQVIETLSREFGFMVKRQRGSHVVLRGTGLRKQRVTVVPLHRELAPGTFRSALNQAGLSRTEFEQKVR
jgi:predicted RNase H-like HicB family nuclease/predicted RNA binding protein YcfA (HicA-like mRNA interferase family)